MFLRILFSGVLFFGFSSCEIINPEEEIPSYISIDTITVTTDYLTQGTKASKITDAWVYIDEQVVGAFELPAKFPVLPGNGNHKIKIKAGIKVNGISTTRATYFFYDDYITSIDLRPKEIVSLEPSVKYTSYADIVWKEDFESTGITIKKSNRSDTVVTITTEDPFEGSKCGVIHLTEDKPFFECFSFDAFILPKGAPVFLELNYKTNKTIVVGIVSYSATQSIQTPALNITPTVNENGDLYWNKIYVNLSNVVSAEVNAIKYEIFIGASTRVGEPDNGLIYLDNIKLVH